MKREIQFRGYSTGYDKWVYGYYVFNHKADAAYIMVKNGDRIRVHPESVGQYIGIEDCNGKRVYEGDISDGEWYGIVEYGIQEADAYELMGWSPCSFMDEITADGVRLKREINIVDTFFERGL